MNGPSADSDRITALLGRIGDGDGAAWEIVARALDPELRRIARAVLRGSDPDATLRTTSLINEAWIRLAGRSRFAVRDRGHFLALAATMMRQIVCDHARARLALKRGGGDCPLPLCEADAALDEEARRFVDLDAALARLAAREPRLVRVVECRFFLGLEDAETAEALGTSVRTVRRDWAAARAWLLEELGGSDRHG
jgi:RNA polymerase sigma factor (TIGR02999 family)